MNYIDTETNDYPLTEYQIKQRHPDTSFPSTFASDRYKPVVVMPKLNFDPVLQCLQEAQPVLMAEGHYEQRWEVVSLPQEAININIVNKKAQLLDQVDSLFNTKKYLPVIFNTNTFNGGIESAQLAKSKVDMLIYTAQKNNIALPINCTFNDINNNAIQLTTDTLQDLAVAIGASYETTFQKKAKLKRDIALLQTVEAVSSFNVQEQWDLA